MTDAKLIVWLRSLKGLGWSGEAADRIEALTEQLAAARDDAKEAEDYAEELEAKLGHYKKEVVDTAEANEADATRRADALEAKLAQAVEAIQFWLDAEEPDVDKAIALLTSTLAEIKGDKP